MTGGKERLELTGVWQELPRHARLVRLAPWLLLAAVMLLLVEVFERRTGLFARRDRKVGQPHERTGWFARRDPRPLRTPTPPSVKTEVPPRRDAVREPAADDTAMIEALRKARERTRGRLDS
jgi:hypothetical protein